MASGLQLNERGKRLADHLAISAATMRVSVAHLASGARIIDCGVKSEGGLQAGLSLARTCLAGLAEVSLTHGAVSDVTLPHVQVYTDFPVAACIASQYAGWQISVGKFFAMGSGPMRAVARREDLFERLGFHEESEVAVGILETRKLPEEEVVQYVSEKTKVQPSK